MRNFEALGSLARRLKGKINRSQNWSKSGPLGRRARTIGILYLCLCQVLPGQNQTRPPTCSQSLRRWGQVDRTYRQTVDQTSQNTESHACK